MSRIQYIRLGLVAICLVTGGVLLAGFRSQSVAPAAEECNENGQKCETKNQTELLFWESISKNLLAVR